MYISKEVSRVRIPLSPPDILQENVSVSRCDPANLYVDISLGEVDKDYCV